MRYMYLLSIITFLLFQSCSPEEGNKTDIGSQPSADDINITVQPTADNPNIVHFIFNNEKMLPVWKVTKKDGTSYTCYDREFTLDYPRAGKYSGTIQMYGKGGCSEAKSFSFKVNSDDPSIGQVDPQLLEDLAGTNQKVWVWDTSAVFHMGCGGLDATTPNWWSPNYSDQATAANYDDELTFKTDGKFELKTNGQIFVNETAAQTMDPVNFPNGSQCSTNLNYVQSKTWAWELKRDDNAILYLHFSQGAFPSYVANPTALGGVYEVLELSANTLLLRWKDSDRYWYYRFKAK